MGNFHRDSGRSGGRHGGFGGGRSFGGGKRFGGRDGGRPEMHQATCSECGASCELPFKPTGDRPVFCSDCFGKQKDGGGVRPSSFSGDRHERPRFDNKQMHDAVCGKCGKECQVPFRPMVGKPVFCNDCFEKGGSGNKDAGEIMGQIKILNAKIDKLLAILSLETDKERPGKAAIQEKTTTKEVVKEKAKTKIAPKKVAAKKKK
jgi:CxxC-x17-CxxC domain-containing protein